MRKGRLWDRPVAVFAALVIGSSAQGLLAGSSHGDHFDFLKPQIVLSDDDRRHLDEGQVIVETLPGQGRQLGVFVATRLHAAPDALVLWTRAIAELKRSQFVLGSGRFSDPPQLSDVEAIILDEEDLRTWRDCAPGDCGLKVSADEIESARRVAAAAGSGWREALQMEFRRLLLRRAATYRDRGLAAFPPMADGRTVHRPQQVFLDIATQSQFLSRVPEVSDWLTSYPTTDHRSVESFLYWSKENYGRGKPVISITQVGIRRYEPGVGLPSIVVTGKQVFATHYVEGALGTTMILSDPPDRRSYLVYVNRSQLDLLSGLFGGMTRAMLERRLKHEAPQVVRAIRARLESGDPPVSVSETR
jgi:hypothetical protein